MSKNIPIILIAFIFSVVLWGFISLSDDYYNTITVPVKLVNFPDGYTSGTDLTQQVSIKIKGEGWKLVNVKLGSDPEFKISAAHETGRHTVNLYNYLSENQWLSSELEVIDLSPDTLSYKIERIARIKVSIKPELNLNFNSGYGLATPVEVSPDSTTVYGPISEIKNLEVVSTKTLTLDELDNKVVKKISLEEKPGMSYDREIVTVTLNVQKIVDKDIENLPVEVLDVPSDRNVVLLPNKVNIGVRGGIEILGKLEPDDFRAYVYYRDVVLDTLGSIEPLIEMPENTSLLYTRPERLRYIIKKFN